jgi:hypothetical protein
MRNENFTYISLEQTNILNILEKQQYVGGIAEGFVHLTSTLRIAYSVGSNPVWTRLLFP